MLFIGAIVIFGLSIIFLIAQGLAKDLYPPKVPDSLWGSTPEHRFIRQIKRELARHDHTLAGREGTEMARHILEQHLEDERAKFGDPRFSWDEQGAIDLAHAYEIEYWDTRP